jgi:hypothetical protein
MRRLDVKKLNPGDEVFWNDPDDGVCSRVYVISRICISGDIITITDVDGSDLECFAKELS